MPVEVIHWNPTHPRFDVRGLRRLPLTRTVNNFGDLIGPHVVTGEARRRNVSDEHAPASRLLAVGSILHLARDGDVVWGSGVNGKLGAERVTARPLDVRAVRGPRTRDVLLSLGMDVPEVFGDPALLLASLHPMLRHWAERPQHDLTVMPNLNEVDKFSSHPAFFSPTAGLERCLKRLAQSRFVVASSLHALVIAESLGIPARAVLSRDEHPLKYEDYYLGTGRGGFHPADSVSRALQMGGEDPLSWDAGPLRAAFPEDLFVRAGSCPPVPPSPAV